MQHKTIDNNYGGDTHYWISDRKNSAVVFTHGALMDHQLFREQFLFFAKDYTIIAWDVPAHGQSKPYQPFSLQYASEQLVKILDREKIEIAHLVGQSMGGYISQIFANHYPERVRSLTILDSSPLQYKYFSASDNWLLSMTHSSIRFYPYSLLINAISKQISNQPDGQTYVLETLQKSSKEEIIDVMREVFIDVQKYLQDAPLEVPILIAYGSNDTLGKVKTCSKQWAAAEQRPLEVIPNASHNANMDNPEYFNTVLSAFLIEHEPIEIILPVPKPKFQIRLPIPWLRKENTTLKAPVVEEKKTQVENKIAKDTQIQEKRDVKEDRQVQKDSKPIAKKEIKVQKKRRKFQLNFSFLKRIFSPKR